MAFHVWSIGVKRGDIQLLGTASYGAPLLLTLVLVLAKITTPFWGLATTVSPVALPSRPRQSEGLGRQAFDFFFQLQLLFLELCDMETVDTK